MIALAIWYCGVNLHQSATAQESISSFGIPMMTVKHILSKTWSIFGFDIARECLFSALRGDIQVGEYLLLRMRGLPVGLRPLGAALTVGAHCSKKSSKHYMERQIKKDQGE
eukprot:TRINITY_DN10387_c1_g1_i2.p1 TRINITY_DN10387_c1_g1~~TRINITY_DN10387_c1_g1_i2.p1  ORF type:complete len:111 (-),score=2.79 TRINITY_DN10387_c1_g1_i2:324-656(-)